jgi:hypothetical protein
MVSINQQIKELKQANSWFEPFEFNGQEYNATVVNFEKPFKLKDKTFFSVIIIENPLTTVVLRNDLFEIVFTNQQAKDALAAIKSNPEKHL